jgi:hypothetical protein
MTHITRGAAATVLAGLLAAAPVYAAGVHVRWEGRSRAHAGLWKAEAHFARFSDGPVAQRADARLSGDIQSALHAFARQARANAGKVGNPDAEWQYLAETTVSLARPDLISAYVTSYWYTGGAHGMTYFDPINFGLVDGQVRPLTLQDLFQPGAGARWRCALAVKSRLVDMPQALWFKPDADPAMKPIDSDLIRQWILTPTAIVFLIEQYIAGPYSSGPIFVKIPYTAFGDKLNPNGPLKPLLDAG